MEGSSTAENNATSCNPSNAKEEDDGIAHIKPQFLVSIENIPKTENVEQNEVQEKTNSFPNKKKKAGRNRNRPRLIKELPQKKLCRNLWTLLPGEKPSSERCSYEKCCFSHDVEGFLENKPKDVGEKCHNFLTYGFCPYGLVCRYGSCHIESFGSVVDEGKRKIYIQNPPVVNSLKKDVQMRLRKKNYDFSKASKVISEVLPQHKQFEKVESLTSVENQCSSENVKEVASSGLENLSTDGITNGNTVAESPVSKIGPASDEDLIPLRPSEKKKIEWRDKLYLAPLTTLGNLPFRRVCKKLGADITCSEMALATCLLQGSSSEWALVKRHASEDCFGVQLCGSHTDALVKCSQLLEQEIEMDFVDINMGCPIDLIYKQGGGSALMRRTTALNQMVTGMRQVLSCPLTLKMRTAVYRNTQMAHTIIEKAKLWGVDQFTVHGRSKEQRYLKLADWDYIKRCAEVADPVPLFGNGDVLTYNDYVQKKEQANVAGIMIARGALMKPWIFTEIKERRDWDISSSERMDILREYVNNGLEHWGSDTEGIEKTRRFLLEWLSFLYRYIPIGLLERPQKINQRPAYYVGRDDLETLMASNNVKDWIKISEMLLGPVPSDFAFLPKHKANSWG